VFQNMTREQLEGVAQRAWRRAQASPEDASAIPEEVCVRIRTPDVEALRHVIEPRLTEHAKSWHEGTLTSADGVDTVDFHVHLKKKTSSDELLALLRASCSQHILELELR
jgi:hypothetical protein